MTLSSDRLHALSWSIVLLATLQPTNGEVVPYAPARSANPLAEEWRWIELEALNGHEFVSVCEDTDERLWFADSSSLYCYDGIELSSYPYPKLHFENRQSALSIEVYAARSGGIYLAYTQGIELFQDQTWRSVIEHDSSVFNRNNFLELDNGAILASSRTDLYLINGDTKKTIYKRKRGFHSFVRHGGAVWFAQSRNAKIVRAPLLENGLPAPYDQWSFYRLDALGAKIDSLVVGPDETLWATSSDASFQTLRYQPRSDRWRRKRLGTKSGLIPKSTIWIDRGADGGLVIRDRDALIFNSREVWTRLSTVGHRLANQGSFLLVRKNGNTIIGGPRSSIYEIHTSDSRWKTYPGLAYQCESLDGTQWFISQAGQVVTYNPSDKLWTERRGGIDTPTTLVRARDGTIWAAGADDSQAAVCAWRDGHWIQERCPELGVRIDHSATYCSNNGDVIFGSRWDDIGDATSAARGLIRLRLEGDSIQRVDEPRFKTAPAKVHAIEKTPDNSLWVGSMGLHRITEKSSFKPFPEFLENRWIDHLLVDSRGALWTALWGIGIYRFENGVWTHFDHSSGLSTNYPMHLLEDPQNPNTIIAGTQTGIARFQEGQWIHRSFSSELSLNRTDHLRQDSDGSIWINRISNNWYLRPSPNSTGVAAPVDGISSIRYRPEKQAPITRFTKRPQRIAETDPAYISWAGTDPWGETPSADLEYATRLNSSEWSLYSKNTAISIANLPPGTHIFEVRARDSGGNIQEHRAQIAFTVISPLWKRPWFLAAGLAIVATIGCLVAYIVRTRMRHAKEIEEVRLSFFTNLSHELRTPLTLIAGPLESALETIRDKLTRERLNLALKGTKKTIHLVNQLLDFRKYNGADWPSRLVTGDLVEFARETVSLHQDAARKKNLSLDCNANFREITTQYDEEKLPKIIDNLVSNAIKYTPEGGWVAVRLEKKSRNRGIALHVEDTGIGIDAKEQGRIFDPFHRAQRAPGQPRENGTGLGLALVHSLVKSLHGQIEVESPIHERFSKRACGTRISVHLPILEVPVHKSAVKQAKSQPRATQPSQSILIVEDDPDIRRFLRLELEGDYCILEAENGVQALDITKDTLPDLVITDVMMPEMDGRELCHALKSDPSTSHIPVIMLTALASNRETVRGLEARADDYIAKPIKPAYLRLKIQNRFDTRARNIERFREEFLKPEGPLERIGTKPQRDEFVDKIIETVYSNLGDTKFDVTALSEALHMSRYTLYRKLKSMTGETPGGFIQKLRLKRAAELILTNEYTVSEISDLTGFNELSYFSRTFKKQFGCKPSEYKAKREKHGRATAPIPVGHSR